MSTIKDLNLYAPSNSRPFLVRRGSQNLLMTDNAGRQGDLFVRAEVTGEARRFPSFGGAPSYNSDPSSLLEVEGWVKPQATDFTVRDVDGEDNLQVSISRDFEGDGRLEITNHGETGEAQIEFPLGPLAELSQDRCNPFSLERISSVKLSREAELTRVAVQSGRSTQVYALRGGCLFEEA